MPYLSPGLVCGLVAAAALLAVLPTCLYRYVEPRGRAHWVRGDEAPSARRAPVVVRVTAWSSFALAQLAVPWLLVPASCLGLGYLQLKLGVARPVGFLATVVLGALAVVQALLSARLLPLGVRLLVGDARLCAHAAARARRMALANGLVLLAAATVGCTIKALPGLVHPWLRAALSWTALGPVEAFAAVGLVHALLLGACASAWAPFVLKSTPR
jgi:hypothetical protein